MAKTATPAKPARRGVHPAAAAAAILPAALSVLAPSGQSGNPNCGVHCGSERWEAKTLSYAGASSLTMQPVTTTVSKLVNEIAPAGTSDVRVAPVETQEVTINAKLLGFKVEGDRDFHIVVQDLSSPETMIVEIPDDQCSGVCSSIARNQIVASRQAFETAFAGSPPSATYRGLSKPVQIQVTGFPLFDFKHPTPQTGLAKNCIEIHPVLSISIPTDQPLTTTTGHEPPPQTGKTDTCMPKVTTSE